MKSQNVIRFGFDDFSALATNLAKAGDNESFIYGLYSKARGPESDIYICKQLILPEGNDLENQSPVSIEPGREYQTVSYGLAYDMGLSIIDAHTHPFSNRARFSATDDHHGIRNAEYISENFPDDTVMGMIVLGKGFDNFEARVWNRNKARFEPVNRLEILGAPTKILSNHIRTSSETNDIYARHNIIPGWQQGLLENLKVFVCGLGGNGSLVFDSLIALGIGSGDGWIKACDPDVLEASNIPRIPYAYPEEIGYSKADIAQIHADYRAPHLNVRCYENRVEEEQIQACVKEANIIVGAIDNDGARKLLNSLAARYMIPYIDLGTEIIPGESSYEAIGQVQMFVPGKTGCLLCSGAIDPSAAALDMMSEEDNVRYENAGYVRGTSETPTPSVLHLNGVVSHLAVSQLLRLLFNENMENNEYLHYNRQSASMFTASVSRNDDCPACGINGYLGAGDENQLQRLPALQSSNASEDISTAKALE